MELNRKTQDYSIDDIVTDNYFLVVKVKGEADFREMSFISDLIK